MPGPLPLRLRWSTASTTRVCCCLLYTSKPGCTTKGEETRHCHNNPEHTETRDIAPTGHETVSYTHLDVYKRQGAEEDEFSVYLADPG